MGVWRRLKDLNPQTHTMGNGFQDRSATNYGISRRMVESVGVEPTTSCLQGRRSPN